LRAAGEEDHRQHRQHARRDAGDKAAEQPDEGKRDQLDLQAIV
jgi:hypothetical protein